MNKLMYVVLAVSVLLVSSDAWAAAGCTGKVSRLWVENDDILYFNIRPSGECLCNFVEGDSKGFSVPANQLNREEQYAALLAAFMADRSLTSWYDWTDAQGAVRCLSWNVSFSN